MKKSLRHLASIAAAVIIAGWAAPAAADFTLRSGGPSEQAMMSRSNPSPADGLAFVRPVLSGVMYRAGFKGGDKSRTGLSSSQRTQLCEAGFSGAFYADFGKNTEYGKTSCGTGTLDYAAARSSRPSAVMKAVHDRITGNGGPVLVHCMWGVHASGALSAMALVQFCGWSEAKAKAYWDEARNDAPCSGGCDKWIDGKFKNFKVDPSLKISAQQQAAICPK
ncbi:hypothetical protein [Primorskyibacter sp. 2E233]|uniref:hypothetical protein n=1 Tax=Primorskyibacter sp. 2E233 TaxID=3413431 RepID=UPI003BF3EF3A